MSLFPDPTACAALDPAWLLGPAPLLPAPCALTDGEEASGAGLCAATSPEQSQGAGQTLCSGLLELLRRGRAQCGLGCKPGSCPSGSGPKPQKCVFKGLLVKRACCVSVLGAPLSRGSAKVCTSEGCQGRQESAPRPAAPVPSPTGSETVPCVWNHLPNVYKSLPWGLSCFSCSSEIVECVLGLKDA